MTGAMIWMIATPACNQMSPIMKLIVLTRLRKLHKISSNFCSQFPGKLGGQFVEISELKVKSIYCEN